MIFKEYFLKDVVVVQKKTINPQKYREEKFLLYSLPAFDNNNIPEKCFGKEISSNKFVITNEMVLFNKLNLRFKRIWNICKAENNNKLQICSTEFIPLIPKKELITKNFLYYYLLIDDFNKSLIEFSSGTSNSHQRINKDILLNKTINIPSIVNQKKISRIFDNILEKIEINNKINNNLYEIGKSFYNYYFKQFEYTSELKESELGKIPIDYKIKTLSEVTKKNNHKVGDDIEFKVLSAVKTGNLQLSEEYFNKNVPSEKLNKYIVVNKDNYAYNPARINIGSIGRNEYDFKTCVSPVYVSFEVDLKYKYFFDFYFKDTKFKSEVLTRASGSVRQSLKYEDFGLINIVYPSEKAIDDFNFIYEEIDRNIKQNENENETLIKLRDTLLPKLMNGDIDLENIEV